MKPIVPAPPTDDDIAWYVEQAARTESLDAKNHAAWLESLPPKEHKRFMATWLYILATAMQEPETLEPEQQQMLGECLDLASERFREMRARGLLVWDADGELVLRMPH
jgi:hypothetical protein